MCRAAARDLPGRGPVSRSNGGCTDQDIDEDMLLKLDCDELLNSLDLSEQRDDNDWMAAAAGGPSPRKARPVGGAAAAGAPTAQPHLLAAKEMRILQRVAIPPQPPPSPALQAPTPQQEDPCSTQGPSSQGRSGQQGAAAQQQAQHEDEYHYSEELQTRVALLLRYYQLKHQLTQRAQHAAQQQAAPCELHHAASAPDLARCTSSPRSSPTQLPLKRSQTALLGEATAGSPAGSAASYGSEEAQAKRTCRAGEEQCGESSGQLDVWQDKYVKLLEAQNADLRRELSRLQRLVHVWASQGRLQPEQAIEFFTPGSKGQEPGAQQPSADTAGWETRASGVQRATVDNAR